MSNDLEQLMRTYRQLDSERKPGEAPFTLLPEAVTAYAYGLIRELQAISDNQLAMMDQVFGTDDPDLNVHQRACAIRYNLEAMRALAIATFYLLPDLDDREDES